MSSFVFLSTVISNLLWENSTHVSALFICSLPTTPTPHPPPRAFPSDSFALLRWLYIPSFVVSDSTDLLLFLLLRCIYYSAPFLCLALLCAGVCSAHTFSTIYLYFIAMKMNACACVQRVQCVLFSLLRAFLPKSPLWGPSQTEPNQTSQPNEFE